MAFPMFALATCALVIGSNAFARPEIPITKQEKLATSAIEHGGVDAGVSGHAEMARKLMRRAPKKEHAIGSSISQVKSKVEINAAKAAKDATMSGQKSSPKLLMRRVTKDKQLVTNPETCEDWYDSTLEHHGCPADQTKKLGAEYDDLDPSDDPIDICCEEKSTCAHFWHHHHGHHAYSDHADHADNHGCPDGETKRMGGENNTLYANGQDGPLIPEAEQEEMCCENISTCRHWWHHHHGHRHGNHGCPDGETRRVEADAFEIAPHVTDPELNVMCCEEIATCEQWWSHHHGHEHANHGCPHEDETRNVENATFNFADNGVQTEEEKESTCCEEIATCTEWWSHHHGHGHANHGCPHEDETRNVENAGFNFSLNRVQTEAEKESTCCEEIATCEEWWSHHHGHGYANHGCPHEGETRNMSNAGFNFAENGVETDEDKESACCEEIATCAQWWSHHHGLEHANHGCNQIGETRNHAQAGHVFDDDETEADKENECCA